MSVLPKDRLQLIQFCETHIPVWESTPTAIGLTAAQVTALNDLTNGAREAYNQAQSARAASKAATTAYNNEVASMRSKAADLVRQIKAYAQLQNNPDTIYAIAQIPPPAAPAPVPAPGVPEKIEVTLESTGAVTLSWEAVNAAASSGAFFTVARKLPGQSVFTSIGGAPGSTSESRRMTFTDNTVPTSAAGVGVQYVIQGQRGTTVGIASGAITVQFGVTEGASGALASNLVVNGNQSGPGAIKFAA